MSSRNVAERPKRSEFHKNGLVGVVPQRHASLEKDVRRRLRHGSFRVAITTRVFMSKVRDVIGRQKDHDRLRHLKAASGACAMYGLPDPVALIVVLHSIG